MHTDEGIAGEHREQGLRSSMSRRVPAGGTGTGYRLGNWDVEQRCSLSIISRHPRAPTSSTRVRRGERRQRLEARRRDDISPVQSSTARSSRPFLRLLLLLRRLGQRSLSPLELELARLQSSDDHEKLSARLSAADEHGGCFLGI